MKIQALLKKKITLTLLASQQRKQTKQMQAKVWQKQPRKLILLVDKTNITVSR